MFTKKQFITLLFTSGIIFLILFAAFYAVAYKKGLDESIVSPDAVIETFDATYETEQVEEVREKGYILPETKIIIKVLDQNNLLIEEQEVSTVSLLNKTLEDITRIFKDYHVEKFTDQEVILAKKMYRVTEAPSYKLGVEGDVIGIIVGGNEPAFISLNLYTKDFSAHTIEGLKNRPISLTIEQKKKLEKNAYYIEEILQNYNE